ncbi:uncharacterized protein Dvir_GJ25934 [Drosophila virilis]|uniref:Uncharacterized protein n=1 Tax=Drosophila virilis TaxID=7244 RepID=A0A0Q9VZ13_DROVI|nr:uncharacterized protein Dvir_GJ25934 [Drosophila virilis]
MPPFCCGGRRCAKQKLEDGDEQAEFPVTVTEAESPLTLKFYARHDWPYFNCTDEQLRRIREKFNQKGPDHADGAQPPEEPKTYDPKHATAQPLTENQIYGWYHHRAYRYKQQDRGIHVFPREADPLIKLILETNLMAKG